MRGDLTIQRLADDHFRIITGAFDGGRDNYWFRKYMPIDGSVTFTDRSQGICTIGVWGPNAEEQSQYLRVYMMHLRKKLEIPGADERLLKTESGIGYRLVIPSK